MLEISLGPIVSGPSYKDRLRLPSTTHSPDIVSKRTIFYLAQVNKWSLDEPMAGRDLTGESFDIHDSVTTST